MHSTRRLPILFLVCFQLFCFAGFAFAQRGNGVPRKVIGPSGLQDTKDVRLLHSYGAFSLYSVNDSAMAGLPQDFRKEMVVPSDIDRILFDAHPFDTKTDALNFPAHLRTDRPAGNALHLIQFVGPIQDRWLRMVEATGSTLVHYVANNAYIVWADEAARAKLDAMAANGSIVQFSSPYHPYFKLGHSLLARTVGPVDPDAEVAVTVQVFDHAGRVASENSIRTMARSGFAYRDRILNYQNMEATIRAGDIAGIAQLPDVVAVLEKFPRELFDEVQGQIVAGNLDGSLMGPSAPGYKTFLDGLGFSTNQLDYPIVDITDDGIGNGTVNSGDFTLHEGGSLLNPTRLAYVGNCTNSASGEGVDGHGHINTSIAGGFDTTTGSPNQDADGFNLGLGINPYGRIAGTRIFDPGFDQSACGGTDSGVIAQVYNSGGRINNNSWGCSGCAGSYDDGSQAYDAGVRDALSGTAGNQELIVVFAAGNSGPTGGTVGTPGNGKNMITVGASENDRPTWTDGCGIGPTGADNAMDVISFSSRGPSPGGRKKPEIIAPGTHIQGTASTNAGYTGNSVCDQFQPGAQTIFAASSGTSHSAPAVAGIASLYYYWLENQYSMPTPSPAMIKAYLLTHTRYLTGAGANDTLPSNAQGYGMPDMTMAFDSVPRILMDQSQLFDNTGELSVTTAAVANSAEPVRIMLVWTDAPGAIGTSPQVNNLDLTVNIGSMYRGNVFSGQFSQTGGAADALNNYEGVFLPAGTTGNMLITVTATNIAGDGVPNTGDGTDQDYALVCYNCIPATIPVIVDAGAALTAEDCAPADGVISPGETVTVDLAVQNIGTADTTNLVGTLQATGGVTTPSGPQNYGVVQAGGPAVSRSFTFTADSGAACGGIITLSLQLQDGAEDLGTVTYTFTLGTVNPTPVSASYSTGNLATPIPDLGSVDIPLVVTSNGRIADINAKVRLNHTFDGDLIITLIHPDGTQVILSNRRGGGGDNFGSGAIDCSGTHTVFDDSAGTAISAGIAPFAGSFRPDQVLSALNGKSVNGTWILRVSDNAALDVGTVGCFQLDVQEQLPVCCGVAGTPDLLASGASVNAESCTPNGALDPDETVTVSFGIINAGNAATTDLVATLQATGGVLAPSGPQNYGVIPPDGTIVSRPFTFVVSGSCGGTLTATLQLQDGAVDLGTVTYDFTLGTTVLSGPAVFSNNTSIAIPGTGTSGPASPFPSDIVVAGTVDPIFKVTVTLTNMNHTFPDDIDILLVSPAGQKLLLMSDAGSSFDLVNVTLTFDDAAASALPDNTQIVSGTFQPTNFGTGDTFSAPAPAGPYGSTLSIFNGAVADGTWSLYVQDDVGSDIGSVAGGWSISITTAVPVCCAEPCMLTCNNVNASNDPGQCGAVVNFAPGVAGTCGVVDVSPPSGSFFPVGTTTVTVTASDAGPTTCNLDVIVDDLEAPTIACPLDLLVPGDSGSGAVVTYPDPIVMDNCPGATFVCAPPSGSLFPFGTTPVACDGMDASTQSAACSFNVTVGALMGNALAVDPAGQFVLFSAEGPCSRQNVLYQKLNSDGTPNGIPMVIASCSTLPIDVHFIDVLEDKIGGGYYISIDGSLPTDSKYLMKIGADGSVLMPPTAVVPATKFGSTVGASALEAKGKKKLFLWITGDGGKIYRAKLDRATLNKLKVRKTHLISRDPIAIQATQRGDNEFLAFENPVDLLKGYGVIGGLPTTGWRLSPRTDGGNEFGGVSADGLMALSNSYDSSTNKLYMQPLGSDGIPVGEPDVVASDEILSADVSSALSGGIRFVIYHTDTTPGSNLFLQKIDASTGMKLGGSIPLN